MQLLIQKRIGNRVGCILKFPAIDIIHDIGYKPAHHLRVFLTDLIDETAGRTDSLANQRRRVLGQGFADHFPELRRSIPEIFSQCDVSLCQAFQFVRINIL